MRLVALEFVHGPGYARLHKPTMSKALDHELRRFYARAFDRTEWAGDVLRRFHAAVPKFDGWLINSLLILTIFVWDSTASASYQFDVWQTDDGLPQSTVTSIVQTRDGYGFPHQGYERVTAQFMLGTQILVAPVLEKGANERKVIFPKGD